MPTYAELLKALIEQKSEKKALILPVPFGPWSNGDPSQQESQKTNLPSKEFEDLVSTTSECTFRSR